MNREAAFVVSAVQRFLHPETTLPDMNGLQWSEVLSLASAHAVTPMIYSALRDVSGIPQETISDLRSRFEGSVRWSLALSAELAAVTKLFDEQGIATIAVKGPLLSEYLYGKLGARSSGDIDLLVKRADVSRISKLLVSNGYRLASTLHWNSDSACLRSRENELSFESISGVSIDVHWRALPEYFASPFDDIDVWLDLRSVNLGGVKVYTFSPDNMFFLLCCHSAKHGFERLGWICDIARFLIVTPDMDWNAILAVARRTRTLRQISLAVHLAEDVLGAPLRFEIPKDERTERLAVAVKNRLFGGAIPPTPHFELARFCLGLFETRRQELRFIAGHLSPSAAEHSELKLPPPLYFLYYPFRPIRLLIKKLSSGGK